MRHLFLINPGAGKTDSTRDLVEQIRSLPLNGEIYVTRSAREAGEITCRAAAQGGPARLYACGGDGTLNAVVQGAAGHGHIAVTNVPRGTGNDFLKIFGPNWRAGFSDLAALSQGPQAAFDLIDCNGVLGIGVACAGVDARIAADVHRYKALPLVSGVGAYVLSLLANVLFHPLSQRVELTVDDFHFQGELTLLCVCSGRYYGGGFMPVGDAMPDDGVLDILAVSQVGRLNFLRLAGAYGRGQYRRYPDLIRSFRSRGATLSSREELTAVVDGEVMRARELRMALSEKQVQFFYPQYLDYRPDL